MILFYHIPKTAGRFIRYKFEGIYNSIGLYPSQIAIRLMVNRGRPVEFKASHSYEIVTGRRKKGDFLFTFLRNPVDVFYSRYNYIRQHMQDHPGDTVFKGEFSRYFRGTLDEYIDACNTNEICTKCYGDPEVVINDYDFVGVSEMMDKSLQVLNDKLSLSIKDDVIVNSVEGDKAYRRKELEKLCEKEMSIYREAIEKLMEYG